MTDRVWRGSGTSGCRGFARRLLSFWTSTCRPPAETAVGGSEVHEQGASIQEHLRPIGSVGCGLVGDALGVTRQAGLCDAMGSFPKRRLVHLCTTRRDLSMDDFEGHSAGGHGGAGMVALSTVKKCRQWEPRFKGHTAVALKVAHDGAEDFLLSEAKIMEVLSHRSIVRYIGFVRSPRYSVIAMERCAGPTLQKLPVEGSGPLAERDALDAMLQLLSAVSYMHTKGVAHLDIKSENVMLRDNPSQACHHVWKLLDFGLSESLGQHVYSYLYASILGTIGYAAPDMFDDRLSSAGFCDIWSLGILFIEMLTGKVALDKPTWDSYRVLIETYNIAQLASLAMAPLRGSAVSVRMQELISLFLRPLGQRQTAEQLLQVVRKMLSTAA